MNIYKDRMIYNNTVVDIKINTQVVNRNNIIAQKNKTTHTHTQITLRIYLIEYVQSSFISYIIQRIILNYTIRSIFRWIIATSVDETGML